MIFTSFDLRIYSAELVYIDYFSNVLLIVSKSCMKTLLIFYEINC